MANLNSFSVYLINKEDYTQFKDLVVDGVKTKPLDIEGGQLFYKSSEKDYYPRWVNGFFGEEKLGDNKKRLRVKSLSAVYFTSIDVDGKRKTFAVAFGNGRYLIKKDYIEHDFGLETSRHAIDASRISSMRTTTCDSSIKDKIIRSAVDIRESEFFLNANTDALTAVSGKVRKENTGDLLTDRTIGGKDSVSMTAYVDVNNMKKFLRQLYDQYRSTDGEGVRYESNIRKLTSSVEIAVAEELLQKAIDNYKTEDKLYLNLPIDALEEVDRVMGYKIDGKEYDDLTTDILDDYPTIESLRNATVIIDGEAEVEDGEDDEGWNMRFQLYEFLYAELEKDSVCYLLVSGKFYRVSKGYKKRVEDCYNSTTMESFPMLKAWDGAVEGKFNKKQDMDDVLVMDQKFVSPEKSDRFEVCDLLTQDKHFIHVKIFDVASQPLGHLFNQGMHSAQCLADEEIRPLIQNKIQKLQKDAQKAKDFSLPGVFDPKQFTVTFLLLCKNDKSVDTDGRPIIPFLAKAVFRENSMVIERHGFKVSLASMKKV